MLVDPLQIRIVEDELGVRSCVSIAADRITVESRLENDWVDTWRAAGEVLLAPGDEIRTRTVGEVFATVEMATNPLGDVGEEIVVVIYGEDGDNLTSSFIVTETMTEGEWTDPTGESTPQACLTLD